MIYRLIFAFFVTCLTLLLVNKLKLFLNLKERCVEVTALASNRAEKTLAGPRPSAGVNYEFEFQGQLYSGHVEGLNLFSQPLFNTTMLETGFISSGTHIIACIDPVTKAHLPYKPTAKHFIVLVANYLLWLLVTFGFYLLVLQLKYVRSD